MAVLGNKFSKKFTILDKIRNIQKNKSNLEAYPAISEPVNRRYRKSAPENRLTTQT